MTDCLCSEEAPLVFARGGYQRDVYGSKLVPVLVKRPTPGKRQAAGRPLFQERREDAI